MIEKSGGFRCDSCLRCSRDSKGEMMALFVKKSKKEWLIFCGVIILPIVALLTFAIVSSVNDDGKPKKDVKSEIATANLDLLAEEYHDFRETLSDQEINPDAEPKTAEYYVILRVGDGRDLFFSDAHLRSGAKVNKEWGREDIVELDVVAIAISNFRSAYYKRENDDDSKAQEVRSETITIYYYNVRKNCYFAKDVFRASELEETRSSMSDDEFSDKELTRIVKDRLGL